MGRGIAGVIPLTLYADKIKVQEDPALFDLYEEVENDSDISHRIKEDILLMNLKDFIFEFYEAIGDVDDSFIHEYYLSIFDDAYDEVLSTGDMESVLNHIKKYDDKGGLGVKDSYGFFDTLGCTPRQYIFFYLGSYKAFLETYSSLAHMEKLLRLAVHNPLSNVVKFGMYG